MMYPLTCPFCSETVDSRDSYSDTMAELREHIKAKHSDQTWETRIKPDAFHYRNGHSILLIESNWTAKGWKCATCGMEFDAAVDAENFNCT